MTKIWHGTHDNDCSWARIPNRTSFFTSALAMTWRSAGSCNDRFHMLVDQHVDRVDGGAGEDTIDYSDADRSGECQPFDRSRDRGLCRRGSSLRDPHEVTEVKNVEDVVGTQFNDTIIGSSGDNRLDGGAGNDKIHAGDGNDTLIGGTGQQSSRWRQRHRYRRLLFAGHTVWADLCDRRGRSSSISSFQLCCAGYVRLDREPDRLVPGRHPDRRCQRQRHQRWRRQ